MAKVAFVLADDFEDSEFKVPYDRIRDAGHDVTVIGTEAGKKVKGKKGKESFTLDAAPRRRGRGRVRRPRRPWRLLPRQAAHQRRHRVARAQDRR